MVFTNYSCLNWFWHSCIFKYWPMSLLKIQYNQTHWVLVTYQILTVYSSTANYDWVCFVRRCNQQAVWWMWECCEIFFGKNWCCYAVLSFCSNNKSITCKYKINNYWLSYWTNTFIVWCWLTGLNQSRDLTVTGCWNEKYGRCLEWDCLDLTDRC